jgi:hypothetical protein
MSRKFAHLRELLKEGLPFGRILPDRASHRKVPKYGHKEHDSLPELQVTN